VRQASQAGETETKAVLPTPFYNASVRSDCTVISHLKLVHGAATRCASFRDACILGRTWLRQRGYGSSLVLGGFGHFEWSTLMAILLEGGGPKGRPLLASGYDSYQMFKATLQFLATHDLVQSPLLHQGEGMTLKRTSSPQVVDGSRGMNILFKMSPWSYRMVSETRHLSHQNGLLIPHSSGTTRRRRCRC
jgi:U3 small nucleolar RNA-associated protein 22